MAVFLGGRPTDQWRSNTGDAGSEMHMACTARLADATHEPAEHNDEYPYKTSYRQVSVKHMSNIHSSNFQLTQSLAVARGVTYDCPRVAKTGAALALGPRVSVARTHVLPTLRRIWWLAGRQQAAPLPGERQKPAMLVSRVGTRRRVGRMHPDGPESDSDLRRAQRRRERPPERSGDVSEGETL